MKTPEKMYRKEAFQRITDRGNAVKSAEAKQKFQEADRLYREGRYTEADALLKELDAAFPSDKGIMWALAKCQARLGKRNNAILLCDQLISKYKYEKAAQLKQRLHEELQHELYGEAAKQEQAVIPEAVPEFDVNEQLARLDALDEPGAYQPPPVTPAAPSGPNYAIIALVAVLVMALLAGGAFLAIRMRAAGETRVAQQMAPPPAPSPTSPPAPPSEAMQETPPTEPQLTFSERGRVGGMGQQAPGQYPGQSQAPGQFPGQSLGPGGYPGQALDQYRSQPAPGAFEGQQEAFGPAEDMSEEEMEPLGYLEGDEDVDGEEREENKPTLGKQIAWSLLQLLLHYPFAMGAIYLTLLLTGHLSGEAFGESIVKVAQVALYLELLSITCIGAILGFYVVAKTYDFGFLEVLLFLFFWFVATAGYIFIWLLLGIGALSFGFFPF